MNSYYKEQLLHIVESWTAGQLDNYIHDLEERIENTKEQIRALKALKKRKNRNVNLRDTGTRGGM